MIFLLLTLEKQHVTRVSITKHMEVATSGVIVLGTVSHEHFLLLS